MNIEIGRDLEQVFVDPTKEDKLKLFEFLSSSGYKGVFECKPQHCNVETAEDNAFEIFKVIFSYYST
jgi:hypothetical protein